MGFRYRCVQGQNKKDCQLNNCDEQNSGTLNKWGQIISCSSEKTPLLPLEKYSQELSRPSVTGCQINGVHGIKTLGVGLAVSFDSMITIKNTSNLCHALLYILVLKG